MNLINPLDIHSKVEIEDLHLWVKKIKFNPRDSKKWRLFMPVWNDQYPPLPEFQDLPFAYISKFLEKDNVSWNHYHNVKREVLIPLSWEYEMIFEDVKTNARFILNVSHTENVWIYVPTWVSHKIISRAETGVLLVLASNPSDLGDEIEYIVKTKESVTDLKNATL